MGMRWLRWLRWLRMAFNRQPARKVIWGEEVAQRHLQGWLVIINSVKRLVCILRCRAQNLGEKKDTLRRSQSGLLFLEGTQVSRRTFAR